MRKSIITYRGELYTGIQGTRILDMITNKNIELDRAKFAGSTVEEQQTNLNAVTKQVALLMDSYASEAEDYAREQFNRAFRLLDEYKSAGSFYVGDNGCYLMEFLDVSLAETDKLRKQLETVFNSDDLYFSHGDHEHATFTVVVS